MPFYCFPLRFVIRTPSSPFSSSHSFLVSVRIPWLRSPARAPFQLAWAIGQFHVATSADKVGRVNLRRLLARASSFAVSHGQSLTSIEVSQLLWALATCDVADPGGRPRDANPFPPLPILRVVPIICRAIPIEKPD